MTQAIKIGNSVYQVDDSALAIAIDQTLNKNDSLGDEIFNLKARLDAAEASLSDASEAKVEADAKIVALQTKLDAAEKKASDMQEQIDKKDAKKPPVDPDGDDDDDSSEEGDEDGDMPAKKKSDKKNDSMKLDAAEVAAYCKELMSVVNEVSPSLKKVDSAFEPDFGLPAIEYKARYLKTIETLPAEAKTRIDSESSDRNAFVEHLYLALKPQPQAEAVQKSDSTEGLAAAIDQNRQLTLDAGMGCGSNMKDKKDQSPSMKRRKDRTLPGIPQK